VPPDPTQTRQEGPTLHGGAYCITYYRDALGQPAPQDRATVAVLVEYDAAGQEILRTTTSISRRPRRNFRCEG
jgi:hypothetical protein